MEKGTNKMDANVIWMLRTTFFVYFETNKYEGLFNGRVTCNFQIFKF